MFYVRKQIKIIEKYIWFWKVFILQRKEICRFFGRSRNKKFSHSGSSPLPGPPAPNPAGGSTLKAGCSPLLSTLKFHWQCVAGDLWYFRNVMLYSMYRKNDYNHCDRSHRNDNRPYYRRWRRCHRYHQDTCQVIQAEPAQTPPLPKPPTAEGGGHGGKGPHHGKRALKGSWKGPIGSGRFYLSV